MELGQGAQRLAVEPNGDEGAHRGTVSRSVVRADEPLRGPAATHWGAVRGECGAAETWAIVLAGGDGRRFGGEKQFAVVAGAARLVDLAVAAALTATDAVVVVLPEGVPWDGDARVRAAVAGGTERADSVRAGLAAVPDTAGVVVVHDAAHPLASSDLFAAVVAAVAGDPDADAAVPVLPLTETLARLDDAGAAVASTVPRSGLGLVQMPHAFRADALRRAHASSPAAVDDASLVRQRGGRVVAVPGDPANVHVTTPAELALARRLLAAANARRT